jgi:hypothetical protein
MSTRPSAAVCFPHGRMGPDGRPRGPVPSHSSPHVLAVAMLRCKVDACHWDKVGGHSIAALLRYNEN